MCLAAPHLKDVFLQVLKQSTLESRSTLHQFRECKNRSFPKRELHLYVLILEPGELGASTV